MADYRSLARKAARQVGVDPGLFASLVQHESGFRPGAGSPAGARGLTQLMPGTAASLARRYGINTRTPYGNLLGGAHYLKEQLSRFGDPELALAAYNAGPGAVEKYGGVPPYAETQAYVRNVLGSSKQRKTSSGPPSLLAPPATVGAPSSSGVDVASLITQNLGDIAMGTTSPLESLTGLNEAIAAAPRAGKPESLSDALAAPEEAPTSTGKAIVATAKTQLGIPYQWGGQAKLGSRTDCSGLLQAAAAANGVSIPRVTYEQYRAGRPVSRDKLAPGDAVFFNMGARGPEHVGIYMGNGKMIEDPHTGSVVRISDFSKRNDYVGARRYD
ncbi:MAG TPA: transglycosylase SLT domain-containing protein [Gaiellaceae bacterium]